MIRKTKSVSLHTDLHIIIHNLTQQITGEVLGKNVKFVIRFIQMRLILHERIMRFERLYDYLDTKTKHLTNVYPLNFVQTLIRFLCLFMRRTALSAGGDRK